MSETLGKWITRKSWKYAVCSNCSFEIKRRDENTVFPEECPICRIKMGQVTNNIHVSGY